MSTLNQSSSEKLIFKCDLHGVTISQQLLSFYEENELFDTVLIAGKDRVKIQTHRIVLSAMSEYFLEIFRGSLKASKTNVVELKEIDATTLKLIIDFMYTGWIELSLEKVEQILRNSAFFKMKTLTTGCCDFIELYLDSNNCLHWFEVAKELNLSGLKEICLNKSYSLFELVSKKKELMLLDEAVLKDLLFNENRYRILEDLIFLSMVAWIEYDQQNREHLTFQLLSMVRYQLLTPKFIIGNRKSVCKTIESYELICSWLEWHLLPETRPEIDQKIGVLKTDNMLVGMCATDHFKQVSIQSYCPEGNVWLFKKGTTLLKDKSEYSVIVINEKMIVVGGQLDGLGVTNTVEFLDLKTFEWTDLPRMRKVRFHCQLANLNGNLCVFGGSNFTDFVNTMEIYDFSTNKWQDVQPLCEWSKHSKIVAHNKILYVIDFFNGFLQSYDVVSNQWTSKALKKEKLKNFGFEAIDGYLYVIGGIKENVCVNTVRRYDIAKDSWCEMKALPQAQSNMKTTVFKKKITIGEGTAGSCLVQEYSPDTDTWTARNFLSVGKYESLLHLCSLPVDLWD